MAGAYQINDEIATYLWGKGSDYVTVVKNPDGTVKEFVITKDNKEKLRESLTEYKSLLPFASPGCLTANYDFVCAQQGEGYAVIQPHQYVDLYPMVYNVGKEKLPEAKFIIYNCIGNKPYTGNYTLSVVRASKNQEAAYWLVRFLASYQVQKEVMRLGIAACRNDVLLDPEWRTPEYAFPIGMMCDYLIDLWKDRAKDTVNYFFFNCKAAGKIYDLQSPLLHKAMSGEASIDEVIEELTDRTVELVSKFDPRPIRVEE
jgi:ABC-type glycerol-3-phosphate transport system substrate-binding protein